MNKRTKPTIIIFGLFVLGIAVPMILNSIKGYTDLRSTWPPDIQYLIHPIFRMLVVLIGWLLLGKATKEATLGLMVGSKQAIFGFMIGFACSLPMLALGLISDSKPIDHFLIYTTIIPGLTEEIFYRAFAFGLMVQILKYRLWPAAIITGMIFGLAHLINASVRAEPIMDQVGWIGMIAVGGLMYAWLYERANWNLWIVIALHAGMNLWWDMFELTSSPLGNWGATISRILAVGISVYFVVFVGVLRPSKPALD
ncbi:MAG: CPBP family intramembrane glutamic endopeptidase [Phycisphaerales bacterium]